MNEVLRNDFLRSKVHSVIVDRECDAVEKAKAHGVRTEMFIGGDNHQFCDFLQQHFVGNGIDYVFSYYTNFYAKVLRDAFQDRIINFHPSLLPAFKRMGGFCDTLAYHTGFGGNTVEFIGDAMDEGKIIMQTVCPIDPDALVQFKRHKIFVQQCKALLQVAKWLQEGRIAVNGRRVVVAAAKFWTFKFSPALDFADAIELQPVAPSFVGAAEK